MAAHKHRTRSFVVRAAVVDTDSWDLVHRTEVAPALVDIPVVDVDSGVDSCWVDTVADQAIVGKQELPDPNRVDQGEEGSSQVLGPTLAVDSLDSAAMWAELQLRKLAVPHTAKELTSESEALQLVDSATLLEIVDSTDCC